MPTTKEMQKLDYVREGVRYTIHVEGTDGGVLWGTWDCHECNVGGSTRKQAKTVDGAIDAAKTDLERHHAANHKI